MLFTLCLLPMGLWMDYRCWLGSLGNSSTAMPQGIVDGL